MKLLINYSDSHRRYGVQQKFSNQTAIREGRFDKVIAYGPQDIDADFREKNKEIFRAKRGGGYWLWKPYILKKTLDNLKSGDFVFYLDSDHFFTSSVMPFIKICLKTQQDIIPFELQYTEKHWTKRDAFILMGCDEPRYTDTPQIMSGLFLLRKSGFSERFVDEWLTYAQDERIISDKPNQCGYPNYPGFQENRHDQSIFSLLIKKHHLQPPSYTLYTRSKVRLFFLREWSQEYISPFMLRTLPGKYPVMVWIRFKIEWFKIKYLRFLVYCIRRLVKIIFSRKSIS